MLSHTDEDRRISIGPRADSRTKPLTKKVVAAAICTACVVGAVAYTANQETSTALTSNLLSVPESFSGTFSRIEDDGSYHAEGRFNKIIDEQGEWRVDAEIKEYWGETTNTYTVVDRVAVMQVHNTTSGELIRHSCLDRQVVPEYGRLKATFEGATVWNSDDTEDDVNVRAGACEESDDKVILNFADSNFAVCASQTSKYVAMKVFGPTFAMDVRADSERVHEEVVLPSGDEELECDLHDPLVNAFEFAQNQAHAGTTQRRLVVEPSAWPYKEEQEERNLLERDLANRNANNTVGKTHCMFLHGVGNLPSGKNQYTATHFHYWGNVHVTSGCTTYNFVNADTKNHGFNDVDLSQWLCRVMKDHNGGTNVLFTHSMGGMISAFAFFNKHCNKPRKYYVSEPPMGGSRAADFVVASCGKWNWIDTLTLAGYCKRSGLKAKIYHGYTTLKYFTQPQKVDGVYKDMPFSKIKWDSSYKTGSNSSSSYKVDMKLCGTSPQGFGKKNIPDRVLKYLDEKALMEKQTVIRGCWRYRGGWNFRRRHEKVWYNCKLPFNDGMVDHASCVSTPTQAVGVYMQPINHADGKCENGDASGSSTAKPCKWFKDMADKARVAFTTYSYCDAICRWRRKYG